MFGKNLDTILSKNFSITTPNKLPVPFVIWMKISNELSKKSVGNLAVTCKLYYFIFLIKTFKASKQQITEFGNRLLTLFDLASPRDIRFRVKAQNKDRSPTAYVVLPNGNIAIFNGKDIAFWDSRLKNRLKYYSDALGPEYKFDRSTSFIALSKDRVALTDVCVGNKKHLLIFDLQENKGSSVLQFVNTDNNIKNQNIVVISDNKIAFFNSKKIYAFDLITMGQTLIYDAEGDYGERILTLSLLSPGRLIFSTLNKKIAILDIETGEITATSPELDEQFIFLTPIPNNRLICASRNGVILILDLRDKCCIKSFQCNENSLADFLEEVVSGVSFFSANKIAVTKSRNTLEGETANGCSFFKRRRIAYVEIWNIETAQCEKVFEESKTVYPRHTLPLGSLSNGYLATAARGDFEILSYADVVEKNNVNTV